MGTVITNVRVFDGSHMTAFSGVRIADDYIVEAGHPRPQPGDRLVDGRGGTLLPGLIDAHLHLLPGSARQSVSFGVTTILDMFSKPEVVAGERRRPTPGGAADVRSSLVGATAPDGHPSMMYAPFPTVTGPESASSFVRERVAEGADYLKVFYDDGSAGGPMPMPSMELSTVAALISSAHDAGLMVVAHVTSANAACAVAQLGADVLAHVPFEPLSPNMVETLAAARVAVIATLSIADGFSAPGEKPALLEEAELSGRLGEPWRSALEHQATRWMPPGLPDFSVAAQNVRRLYEHGVPILAGTDAPNPGIIPGASVHRELQRLVGAGMSPVHALEAATSRTADVFGLTDRGRICAGLKADLLLTEGNPDESIADTQRIISVWQHGTLVSLDSYVGSDDEIRSLAALRAQTERVMAAVRRMLPPGVTVPGITDGEPIQ